MALFGNRHLAHIEFFHVIFACRAAPLQQFLTVVALYFLPRHFAESSRGTEFDTRCSSGRGFLSRRGPGGTVTGPLQPQCWLWYKKQSMSWKTQFGRVQRALSKLEKAGNEYAYDIHSDDVRSFFENCWHLKDWIGNDDALPQNTRTAIVREADQTESLKFCADLANGSKHLKLNKYERKGAKLLYVKSFSTADAKTGEVLSEGPIGYIIFSKHGTPKPYTLVDFAKGAVQDWTALLSKHGMLI